MKKTDNNYFELSTGKSFYAYENILGLNEDLEFLYNGSDGCEYIENIDNGIESDFTKQEMIEICDYQIELWNKLKNKMSQEK